jgi:hypothetical protein
MRGNGQPDRARGARGILATLCLIPLACYHLGRLGSLLFDLDLASAVPMPLRGFQVLVGIAATVTLLAVLLSPLEKNVRRAWRA